MMLLLKLLLLSFLFTNVFAAKYGTVFASSNLRFVFPQMIKAFYEEYPEASIHIQYEGSGVLAKEILDGIDYDLFLAANMKYPEIVYEHKKAIEAPKVYAQGKVVLYLPKELKKKYKGKKLNEILKQDDIRKIIIANKETAPYGRASLEILKSYKIYAQVKHKIQYTQDIATAVYELLWNDEVGFIPKSALYFFSENKNIEGDWIDINQNKYQDIFQGYVLSKNGKNNENIVKFLAFLYSKKGQEIFNKYGYITPQ